MPNYNEEWKTAVRALLETKGLLSGWKIEEATGVSHGYADRIIHKGLVPKTDIAVRLLEQFGREEAIKCMRIAGIPLPADWMEEVNVVHAPKSLSSFLMPTKGESSYEEIAANLNDRLGTIADECQMIMDAGDFVSAKDIRDIFEGMNSEPSSLILDALSNILNVSYFDLLEAAGYTNFPMQPVNPERFIILLETILSMPDTDNAQIMSLKEMAANILEDMTMQHKLNIDDQAR